MTQRLDGLAITHNVDGTSTLTGSVDDQARLYGVLAVLRDIGATLLDLRVNEATEEREPPPSASRPVLDHPVRRE